MPTGRFYVSRLAAAYAGTGAKSETEDYLQLLAGNVESQAMRVSMLSMSSCGLFVRGLWRVLGVQHPILSSSYNCSAISDILSIARNKGALVPVNRKYPDQSLPQAGDVFHIGTPGGVVGSDGKVLDDSHVGVIVVTNPNSAECIATVEGGQVTSALGNCILAFSDRKWTIATDGTISMGSRRLMNWVNCDLLNIPDSGDDTFPPPKELRAQAYQV